MTEARQVKPPLTLQLCAPRGFCAGVDRAIQIVELALDQIRPARLCAPRDRAQQVRGRRSESQRAVFVEELDEIPAEDADRPVIFSAHGVPKSVPADAEASNMFFLDATCPLVSKVHKEAQIHFRRDREILLIGHAGHPEVIGTMGQLPEGSRVPDRNRGRRKGLHSKNRSTAGLHHPDHPFRGRHGRHRRRA